MIDLRNNVWAAVAAVAGIQLAVLGYMVWSRVHLLQSGREITVDVVPVDPRDIFRGDYVVLGYPFSTTGGDGTDPTQGQVTLPEGAHINSPVFVTLAPQPGDGASWSRVKIDGAYPAKVEPGHVVIKGRVDYVWTDTTRPETTRAGASGRIRYGIESYFVPEGEGREIEKVVREKKVRAVLAVGSDGTAAIKALEVEGKRIHEQPVL